jgi:anti-sigma factor ChrR (cupin superfamily)
MKTEHEFRPAHDQPWQPSGQDGVLERVLARDEDDPEILTRFARWQPGADTSEAGVITHGYTEEVYILAGDLHDLTLGRSFRVGDFASRRPGMRHGPYRTETGCVMLEIRYRAT